MSTLSLYEQKPLFCPVCFNRLDFEAVYYCRTCKIEVADFQPCPKCGQVGDLAIVPKCLWCDTLIPESEAVP